MCNVWGVSARGACLGPRLLHIAVAVAQLRGGQHAADARQHLGLGLRRVIAGCADGLRRSARPPTRPCTQPRWAKRHATWEKTGLWPSARLCFQLREHRVRAAAAEAQAEGAPERGVAAVHKDGDEGL